MTTSYANIAAALATFVTFGTMLSACGVGEASDPESEIAQAATPVPVEAALPIRADIFATYSATAAIASDFDAPVTARVAGEIVEIMVEEGDRVRSGQILARLDGERLRLEMLSAEANLERAEKELRRNVDLHERGIVSTAMFEGLKYDLDALRATYELKRLNYEYSNIRATIPGVVSSRDIKSGQNLAVGQVAFRITETSELIAHLQIPQAELGKFDIGYTAYCEVASMPDSRFPATIIRISPTIDAENGTFRATALIENQNHELAPGMFGRFTVAYEKHGNALVIPLNAIVDEDDESTVYVIRDDEVIRRTVETGVRSDGRVEILAGLQEDEAVVVVGHSGLRDGSKVLASVLELSRFTG